MTPRVGIVGVGVIARYYLAALRRSPDVAFVAACDRDPRHLDGLPPTVAPYESLERMLDEAGLDGLFVTLPNDGHATACAAALDAGVHVCCEKPLGVDPGEAAALAARAAAADLRLMTAFHRRYNHRLLDALEAGRRHGDVTAVAVRYLEDIEEHVGADRWYLDPAVCGGCLADNGPNAIDLVRLLLGPVRVRAAVIREQRDGVDLRSDVCLSTGDGRRADVFLEWDYATGERKDVRLTYADGHVAEIDLLEGYGVFKSSLFHEYAGVVAAFAALMDDPRRAEPDGVDVVRLVGDAYAVARGGPTVVPA